MPSWQLKGLTKVEGVDGNLLIGYQAKKLALQQQSLVRPARLGIWLERRPEADGIVASADDNWPNFTIYSGQLVLDI